jgi:excinuclease ABC subunit C
VKAGEEGIEEERRWAMPDLVIIDGGRGQVSAAKEVLDELGLHDLPLAGIAKEREELVLPDRADPVVLPVTSQALYLVQRLRDEAHRFAITYHRNLRAKKATRSAFDDLPGVGPKRRRELLKVFGSAKRVREAPVEQIASVPGISRALAERIKAHLEA